MTVFCFNGISLKSNVGSRDKGVTYFVPSQIVLGSTNRELMLIEYTTHNEFSIQNIK